MSDELCKESRLNLKVSLKLVVLIAGGWCGDQHRKRKHRTSIVTFRSTSYTKDQSETLWWAMLLYIIL